MTKPIVVDHVLVNISGRQGRRFNRFKHETMWDIENRIAMWGDMYYGDGQRLHWAIMKSNRSRRPVLIEELYGPKQRLISVLVVEKGAP